MLKKGIFVNAAFPNYLTSGKNDELGISFVSYISSVSPSPNCFLFLDLRFVPLPPLHLLSCSLTLRHGWYRRDESQGTREAVASLGLTTKRSHSYSGQSLQIQFYTCLYIPNATPGCIGTHRNTAFSLGTSNVCFGLVFPS